MPDSAQAVYVAIERAIVFGSGAEVEGNIYVREADGRLKPIDGRELLRLYETQPSFVRNWRLRDT